MSRYNDLLGSAKQTNAPLYATMQAVKTAFTNRFKFDVFPLVTDDDYKGAVRNDRNIDSTKYPYQYWKVSTIEMAKEYGNVKLLRRHGSAYAGGTSNTAYSMGYFFKATIHKNIFTTLIIRFSRRINNSSTNKFYIQKPF